MAGRDLPTPNSVGWYILEGYPWWPVYICDPHKVRPNMHLLGDGHKKILRKAKDFPKDFTLVYYFGSHDFSLVALKKPVLKPWDCADRELYLKGHPKHLVKKKQQMDELLVAIQEAEDYLSQPEDIRLPPCMVPSDLDPTLEPPPPIERVEVEEEPDGSDAANDENEEDAEMASDAEDDGAGDGEDDEMDGSEDEKKKKKKAKKASDKKKKESSKKEKKEPKAKKEPKETKKDAKEKKKSTKKGDEDKDDKKLKRRRSSATSQADDGSQVESPVKKSKKTADSDVKTEKTKGAPNEQSDEELYALLEGEIRTILINHQDDEEITTKSVRKMLEKKLKRNLKDQKQLIKQAVERVIVAMEDEEIAAQQPESTTEAADDKTAVKTENVKMEEPTDPPAPEPKEDSVDIKEPLEDEPKEPNTTSESATEDSLLSKLNDAKTQLVSAADDESKILAVLKSLSELETVDKDQLKASGLVERLVELRAHGKPSVSEAVGQLAVPWNVEDLFPKPKVVDETELLAMKEKLENSETSHDELLACLQELASLPLDISHLKKTAIPRSVAALRQHANDKVSIAAKNLRNAWMQLVNTDKAATSQERVKKLAEMVQVLEQKLTAENEAQVSRVLEKLYKMSLSTNEIIDSKVGMIVSKLRKSDKESIAKAAAKLRKKWKSEAGAA